MGFYDKVGAIDDSKDPFLSNYKGYLLTSIIQQCNHILHISVPNVHKTV